MEHAKKMILVEPRVLEGMTRNQPVEDATNRDLKETSQTMQDILDSDGAAYDKANAYQQALWGFLKRFEQYKDRPLGKVQLTSDSKFNGTTSTSGDDSTSQVEDSQQDSVERDVLNSVPKSLRNKAERLLSRLKSNPEVKWNELGELEYNGKTIKRSNLTDLVNDVLRKRRRPDPLGWDVFANALRQVNVAQDLIGNPNRWNYIQRSPAFQEKRRSRHEAYFGDEDETNRDEDDWSTPHQTPRKQGGTIKKKKLTWSTMK